MKKLLLYCSTVLVFSSVRLHAQSTPDWVLSDSIATRGVLGVQLNYSQNKIAILGFANDTNCSVTSTSITLVKNDGSVIFDTAYELGYCAEEDPLFHVSQYGGDDFFMFTNNNVITVQDCTFCYRVDAAGSILHSEYTGEIIRSAPIVHGKFTFIAADDPQVGKVVWRIDSTGNKTLLNTITDSYFVTAPTNLLASSGKIYEFFKRNGINDTAAVCYIYDTLGTAQGSFSIDIDPAKDELLYYAFLAGNKIFYVCVDVSSSTSFTTATDLTGVQLWSDTIPNRVYGEKAACIDTINQRAFLLISEGAQIYSIVSIDLSTGTIMDTVLIDSVGATPAGVMIHSGANGGVFLTYLKFGTNDIFTEQYDASLNLLWTGVFTNQTCNISSTPVDVAIDSTGVLFVLARTVACSTTSVLARFTPSLVNVENIQNSNVVYIYPNPAENYFTIQFSKPNQESHDVVIYDLTGKTVVKFRSSESRMVIPTDGWSNGVYFIQVISQDGESTVFKQIIQR
jgi:hypothetical protein